MPLDKNKENLNDILEYTEKIIEYTHDFNDADSLYNNHVYFDAVLMNFVNIGEAVSRISESFQTTNPEIDWANIKGLRNMIAHDYLGIDAEEIWQIVKNDIPHLKTTVNILLDKLK